MNHVNSTVVLIHMIQGLSIPGSGRYRAGMASGGEERQCGCLGLAILWAISIENFTLESHSLAPRTSHKMKTTYIIVHLPHMLQVQHSHVWHNAFVNFFLQCNMPAIFYISAATFSAFSHCFCRFLASCTLV